MWEGMRDTNNQKNCGQQLLVEQQNKFLLVFITMGNDCYQAQINYAPIFTEDSILGFSCWLPIILSELPEE